MEKIGLPKDEDCIGFYRLSTILLIWICLGIIINFVLLSLLRKYGEPLTYEFINTNADAWLIQFIHKTFQIHIYTVAKYGFYIMYALLVFKIIYAIYRIWAWKNTVLFIDNQGVWVHKGVFSWQKEINGIFWADAGMARSRNSFSGMLFNAYPITVSNRYTNNTEINLDYVSNGKDALKQINDIVDSMYQKYNEQYKPT